MGNKRKTGPRVALGVQNARMDSMTEIKLEAEVPQSEASGELDLQQQQDVICGLEKVVAGQKDVLAAQTKELEQLRKDKQQLTQQLAAATDKFEALRRKTAMDEEGRRQLNQQVVYQLAEAAIKLRQKDSKVEELQEEVDELRKAKLAAEDQLMLQEHEGKAAEAQIEELQSQLLRMKEEREDAVRSIEVQEQQKKDLQCQLDSLMLQAGSQAEEDAARLAAAQQQPDVQEPTSTVAEAVVQQKAYSTLRERRLKQAPEDGKKKKGELKTLRRRVRKPADRQGPVGSKHQLVAGPQSMEALQLLQPEEQQQQQPAQVEPAEAAQAALTPNAVMSRMGSSNTGGQPASGEDGVPQTPELGSTHPSSSAHTADTTEGFEEKKEPTLMAAAKTTTTGRRKRTGALVAVTAAAASAVVMLLRYRRA